MPLPSQKDNWELCQVKLLGILTITYNNCEQMKCAMFFNILIDVLPCKWRKAAAESDAWNTLFWHNYELYYFSSCKENPSGAKSPILKRTCVSATLAFYFSRCHVLSSCNWRGVLQKRLQYVNTTIQNILT